MHLVSRLRHRHGEQNIIRRFIAWLVLNVGLRTSEMVPALLPRKHEGCSPLPGSVLVNECIQSTAMVHITRKEASQLSRSMREDVEVHSVCSPTTQRNLPRLWSRQLAQMHTRWLGHNKSPGRHCCQESFVLCRLRVSLLFWERLELFTSSLPQQSVCESPSPSTQPKTTNHPDRPNYSK